MPRVAALPLSVSDCATFILTGYASHRSEALPPVEIAAVNAADRAQAKKDVKPPCGAHAGGWRTRDPVRRQRGGAREERGPPPRAAGLPGHAAIRERRAGIAKACLARQGRHRHRLDGTRLALPEGRRRVVLARGVVLRPRSHSLVNRPELSCKTEPAIHEEK